MADRFSALRQSYAELANRAWAA